MELDPLDGILYSVLLSSPNKLVGFAALGTCFEGIVVGAILAQTSRYFEAFGHSDALVTRILVGTGGIACIGQLALNIWQTYRLINTASTSLGSILQADIFANMVVILLVGISNFAAAVFYSRRAWKLAGGRWWIIGLLSLGIIMSLCMSIGVMGFGLTSPKITLSSLPALAKWLSLISNLVTAWAAISLATDICVSCLMATYLLRSKSSFLATNKSLLKKMIMLTVETMLPPIVVVVAMLVLTLINGTVTLADFTRTLTWILGPLYFHSILYSLVGRQDLSILLHQSFNNQTAPSFSNTRVDGAQRDPIQMGTLMMRLGSLDSFTQNGGAELQGIKGVA